MFLNALFTKVKKDDLFNLYPDATLILQSDGKILDVNNQTCNLFEYSRFNMVGENITKYVPDAINAMNKITSENKTEIVKLECASKVEKYGEISITDDEENEKIYLVIRDVTKKYQKQNSLNGEFEIAKNIIDDKNVYLTNSSNEILSCTGSIESFSKALIDGVGGALTSKQEKYVNIINKNAKELLYNLDKMFLLFKTESKLFNKTYKTFDIVNLINDTTKKWNDLFKAKNLRFNCDVQEIAYRNVCLDPVLVELIIDNILEASYKNTEVGTVNLTIQNPTNEFLNEKEIEAQEDENLYKRYVVFEFKDSSAPLNEEENTSIFEPYKLIKNPQKRSMGTKFTYPAVRKIVQSLGGNIWITSKPSLGVAVTILLPIERITKK
ncbi:MAG: PAS domain S-box protein [Cyanobacteria bacterium SIG30]|nr:PAS domain S-box protein [Cyanobacteria bacterium SIG30]